MSESKVTYNIKNNNQKDFVENIFKIMFGLNADQFTDKSYTSISVKRYNRTDLKEVKSEFCSKFKSWFRIDLDEEYSNIINWK